MNMFPTFLGRASRALVVTLGVTLGTGLVVPAHADPPSTWEEADTGSVFDGLWLVGIALLVILLITLLVYLPSMIRGQSKEPALAFQDRPEWFGGPRTGVAAAQGEQGAEDSTKGGASARW
jgi:hypothetical protein